MGLTHSHKGHCVRLRQTPREGASERGQYVTHVAAACVFCVCQKGERTTAAGGASERAAFDVGGKEAAVIVVARVLNEEGPPSSSSSPLSSLPDFQDRRSRESTRPIHRGAPSPSVGASNSSAAARRACAVHPWRTSMPKTIVGGSSSSNRLRLLLLFPHRHCHRRYLPPPVPTRPPPTPPPPPEGTKTDLGGPSVSG